MVSCQALETNRLSVTNLRNSSLLRAIRALIQSVSNTSQSAQNHQRFPDRPMCSPLHQQPVVQFPTTGHKKTPGFITYRGSFRKASIHLDASDPSIAVRQFIPIFSCLSPSVPTNPSTPRTANEHRLPATVSTDRTSRSACVLGSFRKRTFNSSKKSYRGHTPLEWRKV